MHERMDACVHTIMYIYIYIYIYSHIIYTYVCMVYTTHRQSVRTIYPKP